MLSVNELMAATSRGAIVRAGPPPAATGDLKETIEGLAKDFEDFKAANDERIAELKKLGTVTPEVAAKVEKADLALDELKVKLDGLQAAQRRELEDMETRLNRRGLAGHPVEDREERAHAAGFMTVSNVMNGRNQRVRAESDDLDMEGYRAYREAFETLIRRQCNADALGGDIRNALSVGSDPDGGWLAPDEISTEIEKRIYDTSPMRQIARVISIGGPAWSAPYMSSKGVSGGWVGEKQSRSSTGTPTVGVQRIETNEQYAYPEVTQDMLDDAALAIEGFLVDETEMEMSRTENTGFVTGNGVLKPKGFAAYGSGSVTTNDASRDWGKLQYVPVGAAGAFPTDGGSPSADDPDALITTISKLNPVYRPEAQWAMNRSSEAEVRKLKDRDGRYLVGFGDLRDSVTGFSLLGFPITNLEDMADIAANSYSIAFGNFRRGYYIIDRMGFRVLRDPYTNKPFVGFYITKRVGGDVRNFDAIKLIKFAAS